MALFKLALKYKCASAEKFIEIEAKTPNEAKSKCENMVHENRNEIERLSKLNVYTSNILESCRLCSYDYKLDILSVNGILDLKYDI